MYKCLSGVVSPEGPGGTYFNVGDGGTKMKDGAMERSRKYCIRYITSLVISKRTNQKQIEGEDLTLQGLLP